MKVQAILLMLGVLMLLRTINGQEQQLTVDEAKQVEVPPCTVDCPET